MNTKSIYLKIVYLYLGVTSIGFFLFSFLLNARCETCIGMENMA